MKRSVVTYALCVLALLTLADVKIRRQRERAEGKMQKEALRTWEDEGGALR